MNEEEDDMLELLDDEELIAETAQNEADGHAEESPEDSSDDELELEDSEEDEDLAIEDEEEEPAGEPESESELDRITSYNVCYTKLLRSRRAEG